MLIDKDPGNRSRRIKCSLRPKLVDGLKDKSPSELEN